MPYYGPRVLPETPGTDAWRGVVDGAKLASELQRQDRLDKETQLDREIQRQQQGVRRGTAPAEGPTSVTVPDVPTFGAPDPATLGRVLSGGLGPAAPHATPPFAAPSDGDWTRGIGAGGRMVEQNGITGVPSTSTGHVFGDGSDLGSPGQAPRRDQAQLHPGAFDPTTRTFGGSPLQQQIAQQHAAGRGAVASPGRTVALPNSNPRYAQLDEGHFVDNLHTSAAERERERMDQAEFQRSLRGEDRADALQAAELERRRKAEAYALAGVDPQRAALYSENPSLAANDPRFGKAAAPVMGSPEWLRAQEAVARIREQHRPPAQEPLVQVQNPDGSIVYVPRSQAAGQAAPQRSAVGSATLKKAIAGNQTQVTVIDDALAELEKHPNAVGLLRKLGDTVNQRLDPDGVNARASLANISSLVIHDRSGAAVTAAEFPRLAPFVPLVSDNAETVRKKLTKLKGAIAAETSLLEQQLGGGAPAAGLPTAGPPAAKRDPILDKYGLTPPGDE